MKRPAILRLPRLAVLLAIMPLAIPGIDRSDAQAPTPPAPAPLVFGVASIKRSDLSRPGLPFRLGLDTLTTYGPLRHLIALAYEIEDLQDVVGGPAWAQSEFYDIEAKADAASSPHEIKVMLRALLADRFQLKLHRETRTMAGYVLTVDKGGAKLPPPRSDMAPGAEGPIQLGGGQIWSRGATIHNLAEALRLDLGFPVVDETKIEGNYDFKLQFEESNNQLARNRDGEREAPEPGISIFTALRGIGLRLDSRKVPVEVLVIDSAERPSAN
jgi:uncharacterized protein (TIGR03435 family)